MKSAALIELERLANEEARRLHPTMPFLAPRRFTDNTANALTQSIIAFLRLKGHFSERINTAGRPIDNRKIVADVTGFSRQIGSLKWIKTSGIKGSADIHAVLSGGKSLMVEVKMRDRQSPDQKSYQLKIQKAGGYYWLVRSFEEFLNYYQSI